MPLVDLTDDEHAAVTAAVRRTISEDRYPRSPRPAPLKSALAKLDPASVPMALLETYPGYRERLRVTVAARKARR